MNTGILGYIMRVGVFLVAGPIVGGLAYIVAASFVAGPGMLALLVALPFFLAGCYVMGWKTALATGLLVAFVGPHLESRPVIVIMAAIVGALAAAALGSEAFEKESGGIVVISIVGAVSAAVCAWFLDRIGLMRAPKLPPV